MNRQAREHAQNFLHQGERLIAACGYELGPGVPTPPEELIPPAEPAALNRRIEERIPGPLRRLIASQLDPRHSRPAAAANSIDRMPDAVDHLGSRMMHGKSMEGGWRSTAGEFLISRAGARGSVEGVLAVTDRRWIALTDVSPLWRSTPAMKQYWEAPRAAVSALRANPKGMLQKGRVDIEFTDGSWVAVLASPAANAAPFAAAAAYHR
ncbi:hypothetical protein HYE82_33795 [Streptomyces sp. BR123]|uniref:hypothetical protein n=1 Tax=Streptomyces sp. BR123 TaxID=2749828 RepID=UPI0015C42237|nr:hypothetical protein [Streptomyces sp. BR123]NXY99266.1 hypothetical protein [Streptomyces sp. BR123]